ncbi:TonB-dependent receptor domain-containing protein [Algoriphagus aquimarinus]|uniref:Outer membrane receptor proteins, mostly Fe transport n=1 Tax=Algoriphagus aquimarinus TaxID=237018 RepID=A0A1I0Z665_9BACT|nr:TonB-dependent receptor [Algoriphagus aquimarinus]SFB21095.1 Outer membrane receptor proteins, mostly Fe transport [Algoriphagus aquimarinus]|tara:strand:+ start:58588 stop:61101 length:2514 start_codon:yes stop_codon:yes gene_type:complete
MKKLFNIIAVILLVSTTSLIAQQTPEKVTTPSKIIGIAKDVKTGEPVAYATAALYVAGSDTNVAGGVADGDGKFFITGMDPGSYDLKISFLGFETKTVKNIQVVSKTGDVNIGEIELTDEGLALEEVTVQGQRDLIEERVDRTIYKAENDKTTAGGDGTDVLRRVPMLSVDLDGNVSMRGSSNITVLIDGRPSAIAASSITDALKQIPADEIKEVEVITSPSAKYDAEGTSGVINIITKKNNLQGMSANIRTGFGLRGSDLGLNASARKGKFGFSLGGHGRAGYNTFGSFDNQQVLTNPNGTSSTVLQSADTKSNQLFGRYNFGVDYEIDKYNFLTAAVNFGIRNRSSNQENFLTQNFVDGALVRNSLRETDTKDNSNSVDVSLNYTKTFEEKGKDISLLTLYSRNNGENSFVNTLFSEDMSTIDSRLKNDNPSKNEEFTVQLDFVEPLGKDGKSILEYGAKNILRKAYSDFAYFQAEGADGEYVENLSPSFNNEFSYDQNVTAGYVSYTATLFKNYTIKPGIRYEYTTINADFKNETTVEIPSYGTFVPSLNLSRKLANGNLIKAAYNRRISRPSLRYLNPNIDSSNPLQVSQGNPELSPEFTDNYELGYSTFFKGTMVSFSGFFRNTTGSIQSVRTIQEDGVIYTSFDNIGHENAIGTNIFTNISISNKFSLNGSVDAYYSMLDNGLTDPLYAASNEGFVISGRMFGNYTLPKDWQVQLFTFARGRSVQLQGSSGGFAAYGMGINKQFDEKRGSIGFGADNFLSKEFKIKNEIITPTIVQNSTNIMRNMNFKVNFSYRIGKLSIDQKVRKKKSVSNDDLKGGGTEGGGAEMTQNK